MKYPWLILTVVMVLIVSVPVLGQDMAELINLGFEDLPEGVAPNEPIVGAPYGWTLFGPLSEKQSIEITDEAVRTGSYALKLNDGDTTKGVGVRSAFLPVKEGDICLASVYTFIPKEGGASTAMMYLEFWDEAKRVRVEYSAAKEVIKGQWTEMSLVLSAPSEAKYVTILLYSNVPATGIIYFDDAKLENF
jgi:hypothetical protein